MKQLYKRFSLLLVVFGAILLFSVCILPNTVNQVYINDIILSSVSDNSDDDHEIQIWAESAGAFGNDGMYLCRPAEPSAKNVYFASISTKPLYDDKTDFNPVYTALVSRNDVLVELEEENQQYFWFEESDNKRHVFFYLRENAPAGLYGIRCAYEEGKKAEFLVLYTDEWTYIKVTDSDGNSRRTNFGGGDKTLSLMVSFNDGAARPDLDLDATKTEPIAYNAINSLGDIVSLNNMHVRVKTLSGDAYLSDFFDYEVVKDRVDIKFKQKLNRDVYIIQFISDANSSIIGQYVIDNTSANAGVNLSRIWALLMIFGGVLTLVASAAYLVPFFIVKVNEMRVYKENEHVDRMKNPEKYSESDKKSLKGIFSKIIYNIKTPAYKRKQDKEKENEAQKPVEEKVYTNRFTEMLRERQEKRDFMRENNLTSEQLEAIQEAKSEEAKEVINSFASLRDDDDDDIATFHAAEDEISTLETGAYTESGTTFAKLDSLRDDELHDGNNDSEK